MELYLHSATRGQGTAWFRIYNVVPTFLLYRLTEGTFCYLFVRYNTLYQLQKLCDAISKEKKLEVTDYCPFQGILFVISKEY